MPTAMCTLIDKWQLTEKHLVIYQFLEDITGFNTYETELKLLRVTETQNGNTYLVLSQIINAH